MKTYDIVHTLLKKHPELRSSDRKLLWAVWEYQGLASTVSMTKIDFMQAISAESVTRARRKVQEVHPELQAKQEVVRARKSKAKKKGTFIFNEETQSYRLVPIDYEENNTMHDVL